MKTGDAEAARDLGRLRQEEGDLEGARRSYEQAIAFRDEYYSSAAAIDLAELLASQGNIDAAHAAYRIAINSSDYHAPGAAIDLGRMLAEHGDTNGARAAYEEAIAYQDDIMSPRAAIDLAELHASQGNIDGTYAACRTLIEVGRLESAVSAATDLARGFEEKNDFEGARIAYQQAIEIAGGPDKASEAVSRLRGLQSRVHPKPRDLERLVAYGPDIPAVFKLESDPDLDLPPVAETASLIDLRVADVSVLIGSGELEAAEKILAQWCSEEEKSEWGPAQFPFDQLARTQGMRGDLPRMRETLRRYRDLNSNTTDRGLGRDLMEWLANEEQPGADKPRQFFSAEDNGPLHVSFMDRAQFCDTSIFFRPLPNPALGGVRFVLVGGPMCFVDRRGEHSCSTADSIDGPLPVKIAEDTSRVATLTEDPAWTTEAVRLCQRLLLAAQRCGESSVWAFAAGFVSSSFRSTIKDLGERPPKKLKVNDLVLQKPPRGTWLYHREPSTLVLHQRSPEPLYQFVGNAPKVALWRWPDRSDLVLQAWCDTLASASADPVTAVLPDTPMLRGFARRYVRRERMDRIERTYLENAAHFGVGEVPNQRGDACYLRVHTSLVIDSDGTEWDGDLLTAALNYLETHYQLRIPPFDAVRDPLLTEILTDHVDQLRESRAARIAWRPDELQRFNEMRSWYARYREQGSRLDIFRIHTPVSYAL
ncbi:hypothetical protein GCM10023321_47020 [Pseudonocardia eucalypti]|uniref:Ancillary SecYEG translocon subunit/Cell division coordinator CpoB TPR domain-containing protein n=1 Tax=Pseudonocardia eucalypti TaxID=648755 RepID=A0ABP9QHN7_9PSEU|nr:tetratricopeptide (TPR) repeat protein [Pseudonocardia eucalypti]